jgi:formate/nitrite transporter
MQEPENLGAVFDAHPPREIARLVETLGVSKARADAGTLLLLAVLAGAFIALGALFSLVASTLPEAPIGARRLLGGLAFCLGLILVVVAGAELFTGNNLLAMAWASRRITTKELARNWALVYAGNVLGALGTVALALAAGLEQLEGGAVGGTALRVGIAKAALGPMEAMARGILCNALVCLAVWLAMGGRSVTDKILAIVFPITAFVALGLEHSIANWFFLPYAIAVACGMQLVPAGLVEGAFVNVAWVTLGNVLGGSVLVAGVYWLAYLRPAPGSRGTPGV